MKNKIVLLGAMLLLGVAAFAGTGVLKGKISAKGATLPGCFVEIKELNNKGAISDGRGRYTLKNVKAGNYTLVVSSLGFRTVSIPVTVEPDRTTVKNVILEEDSLNLDEIVVTGTKTAKRKTDSPVIVNVVNSQTLQNVQACTLSEGLKFQPGLRVETDCQTCNYTQLRMNGLQGGYSQILINGRPIFSPLTGLYGMEQIPANMIDRIEVVRGGGSSLYGSSAIGGTVNVITKMPIKNSCEVDYTYQRIHNQTNDHSVSGNATLISEERNAGVSFFMNHRERGFYEANGDNFSEIPMIKNTSIGTNMFFLPTENQKLELNISNIHEFRFGGEMFPDIPAYLTQQSEERTHDVWMASLDYQINFNDDKSSFITYLAWQDTDRKHYTGTRPDKGTKEDKEWVEDPPYGTSDVVTYNIGMQLNHTLEDFLKGKNILTFGAEYVYDDVLDKIPTYHDYETDQTTKDFGMFLQSDWEFIPNLTLLSGVRMDKHNLLDKIVLSPRASLLYKYKKNTQFRLSYGTGFRAPQAFDTDLHIAFAGGGVSRITLANDLKEERSRSWSASINYDKPMEHWIAGFTVEAFHNRLKDVFYLEQIGSDEYGDLFEKRNGDAATIMGATLELRANYDRKVQFECGITLQSSKYDTAVAPGGVDGLPLMRDFVRAPKEYGFAVLNFTPNKKWNATLNYVYTGKMKMPHVKGEGTGNDKTVLFTSEQFSEFSTKVGYTFSLPDFGSKVEVYGGVKNMFNSYQQRFDIGKNRDSNFIYGPALPRTVYLGLKLKFN